MFHLDGSSGRQTTYRKSCHFMDHVDILTGSMNRIHKYVCLKGEVSISRMEWTLWQSFWDDKIPTWNICIINLLLKIRSWTNCYQTCHFMSHVDILAGSKNRVHIDVCMTNIQLKLFWVVWTVILIWRNSDMKYIYHESFAQNQVPEMDVMTLF